MTHLIGVKSSETQESLLLALLSGPCTVYFNTEEAFDKANVEASIETCLASIRQQFKEEGVTLKQLTQSFVDTIALIDAMKHLSPKEQSRQLKEWGCQQTQNYLSLLQQCGGSQQSTQMMDMLRQMHYGQLVNFDYKF